jgi:ferredoxin
MFIDPERCIGCCECVAACRECGTHKGYSMIFVAYLDRSGKAVLDSRSQESYSAMKVEGTEALAPGSSLNFRYPTVGDTAILVRARPTARGRAALEQARLIMLVMLNVAQL